MKKALVIVLTLVLALSVVALASCSGKTYDGEYSYKSAYGDDLYGCKVHVTIQGNVITKVVVEKDSAEYRNLSAGWTDNYQESGKDSAGKTNWRLHGQEMADSFVGLTVEEVLNMKVFVEEVSYSTQYDKVPAGQPVTNGKVETIKYIPEQLKAVVGWSEEFNGAGATQSSGRLVLAVQDALLKSQGKTENPNCVPINNAPTEG